MGIKTDSKLMFDSHVKSLSKKASQKLNALPRVAYELDCNQRKLLLNAFITSQFSFDELLEKEVVTLVRSMTETFKNW